MNGTDTTMWQRATAKLPSYWKLATLRCSIYAFIVGSQAFDTGIEGFDRFADMSQMAFWKLWEHVLVAMAATWVAFLDQSMTAARNATKPNLTAADITTPATPAKPAGT